MTRLLLLALLLSASAASAREAELDAGAPPACNKQIEEREDATGTDPVAAPKSAGPTTPARTSNGARTATPRWNSLLPGMFR